MTVTDQVTVEQPGQNRLWLILIAAVTLLPWLWLTVFALFVVLVTRRVGHLPTYGQPDPKVVDGVSYLYYPIMLLLPAVLISPIAWLLINGLASAGKIDFPRRRMQLALYVAGILLFSLVLFGQVGGLGGLMNWLLD